MIIYFLRHASAGQHLPNPKKDEKRALDETGIQQCGDVGRALSALDVQVDMVISSPLKRAAQTASLVGNEIGFEGKIVFDDALRPSATFADFHRMVEKYSRHEAIMVVGHNPNLSEFLGRSVCDGCRAGGDLPQQRRTTVVHYPAHGALSSCRSGREIAPEDFAEIGFFLFHRPQLQVNTGARLRGQGQADLRIAHPHADCLGRPAASQMDGSRQTQEHGSLAYPVAVFAEQGFHGLIVGQRP
jgi:phosphohistidine phosphatase